VTKKISETLAAARATIADPKHWTQGAHARNAAGETVNLSDEDACCFCADGALALAAGVRSMERSGIWIGDIVHYNAASDILCEAAQRETGEYSFISVNDSSSLYPKEETHRRILTVMDRGIDIAKSREELGMARVAP
jgi:hypothetical protein